MLIYSALHIGYNMRRIRHSAKLSIKQLVKLSQLTEKCLVEIECGDRVPAVSSLCSIAKALKVTPNTLLEKKVDYLSEQ